MAPPTWLRWTVVALIVAGAITAAVARDPWDPDETRCLAVARELLASGNPFLLTLDGAPYHHKPPLYFWTIAPFVAVLGPKSAVAGALPSLLALVAVGLATRRLARTAGLERAAQAWAPVVLMTCLLPCVLAAGARMDLLFTLWTTLALDRLVALAATSRPRRKDHLMLWLWIALGVLTKGPLAIVLPLLAAVVMARADRRAIVHAVRGWGPLLALVLVAAWVAPATASGGGLQWLRAVTIEQNLGRLVSSFAHREPWWYHLVTIPLTILPWSPVVLPAAVVAWTQRHGLTPHGRLLIAYPLSGIVLLTAISSKTLLYPLPLFAPVCVLAAWWLTRRFDGLPQRVALAAGGAFAMITAIVLALAVAPHRDFQLGLGATAVLSASFALPGLAAVACALTRRGRHAAGAVALAAPLFLAVGWQPLVPHIDRLLSLRPVGELYARLEPDATMPGLAFAKVQPGYTLFADRPFRLLTDPEQLRAALAAGRVVAVNIKEASRLAAGSELEWREIASLPYRHSRILLIGAVRPGPADRPPR